MNASDILRFLESLTFLLWESTSHGEVDSSIYVNLLELMNNLTTQLVGLLKEAGVS
jgi:hypothetical protein